MHKSELDVAVALIFFIRPDTLKEVFEKVKEARPKKLFLIQDGPRKDNENDLVMIQKCRDIVEAIDWECEVYKNYSNINLGCGNRPHSGITWVFEHVESAIILEDDCIPTDSFFMFCKLMLDKYKNDLRIGIISGLNYFGHYNFNGDSYGFAKTGAIWGWATWKDRWDKYDYELKNVTNEYLLEILKEDITPKFASIKRINTWQKTYNEIKSGKEISYWDFQWGFIRHINSWVSIVPKYNQIKNVGIGTGSTHSGNNLYFLPKKIANFFFMETENLEFPLKYPDYVLPNRKYDTDYYKIIYPNVIVKIFWKLQSRLKKMFIAFLELFKEKE